MARLRKRIQFIILINNCLGGDCVPRVRRLLKKVGSKSLTVMYYAPVILYVYSYVIYNYMTQPSDNPFTK